ncbi:hypothetical protein, partial [Streptomyces sp. NPDC059552]|uniref:hypothetical protein n=1 Tax=Streptomyces sp. NPDC059552 TaxID=3346862 RepID=UPI0036B5BAF3
PTVTRLAPPPGARGLGASPAPGAPRLDLSPDFMRSLATLLIDEACRLEDEIIDAPAAAGAEALR